LQGDHDDDGGGGDGGRCDATHVWLTYMLCIVCVCRSVYICRS